MVDKWWRRLDPRIKLISIFSLAVAVGVTPHHHYRSFLVYAALIISFALLGQVRIKSVLLRSVFLLPLLIFLGVTLRLFSRQPWPQQVLIFSSFALKTVLTFFCIGLLGLIVPFPVIIRSLEMMRFPKIFISVLGFTYRYVLLFQQEAGRIMRARRSRCVGKRKRWQDLKAAAFLIPSFLFRVLERSQRIYIAMLSRGYRDALPTYVSAPLTLSFGDYGFGILFHLVLLFALVWR
jgi:cobalt/nickel transport system permease protein